MDGQVACYRPIILVLEACEDSVVVAHYFGCLLDPVGGDVALGARFRGEMVQQWAFGKDCRREMMEEEPGEREC